MPENLITRRHFLSGLPVVTNVFSQKRSPILLPNTPKPKFWFGQTVKLSWASDDLVNFGKIYWMTGFVVGLVWDDPARFDNPDNLIPSQWWYYVQYQKFSERWLEGSTIYSSPEEDLILPSTDIKLTGES